LIYVGTPDVVPNFSVDPNSIVININNRSLIDTLTLTWEEPFNNFNPITNYTVTCSSSSSVTCPPDFTTQNNTVRQYTINNILLTRTDYLFSIIATNNVGSGTPITTLITGLVGKQ